MLGQVASLLVADEALLVSHVLHSFTRREINPIHIHGVRVPGGLAGLSVLGWQDEAIPSALKLPKSYHVLVELSCLIGPLLPFPPGLFLSFWEGGGSHHDSELIGYPSLEGIHQDAVNVNSTVCLGQSKGGGVLVEVTIELVHA